MAEAMSKIEEMAARNAKQAGPDPCAAWDDLVAARMAQDGCDRTTAVDRCLVKHSNVWQACCAWDARQPKTVTENGVQVRTGNWGNAGPGTMRRIPRRP